MTGQQVMARLRERDGDGELLELIKRIAAAHDVTAMELIESRKGAPSDARFALWNALFERGHWNYSRLGDLFGRDHTTIRAGIDSHRARNGLAPLVVGQGKKYRPPTEQYLRVEVKP